MSLVKCFCNFLANRLFSCLSYNLVLSLFLIVLLVHSWASWKKKKDRSASNKRRGKNCKKKKKWCTFNWIEISFYIFLLFFQKSISVIMHCCCCCSISGFLCFSGIYTSKTNLGRQTDNKFVLPVGFSEHQWYRVQQKMGIMIEAHRPDIVLGYFFCFLFLLHKSGFKNFHVLKQTCFIFLFFFFFFSPFLLLSPLYRKKKFLSLSFLVFSFQILWETSHLQT